MRHTLFGRTKRHPRTAMTYRFIVFENRGCKGGYWYALVSARSDDDEPLSESWKQYVDERAHQSHQGFGRIAYFVNVRAVP